MKWRDFEVIDVKRPVDRLAMDDGTVIVAQRHKLRISPLAQAVQGFGGSENLNSPVI